MVLQINFSNPIIKMLVDYDGGDLSYILVINIAVLSNGMVDQHFRT